MTRKFDSRDYEVTGKCCQCENRAVKFESLHGSIFELCFVHGNLTKYGKHTRDNRK